jgi:hypothetical protein
MHGLSGISVKFAKCLPSTNTNVHFRLALEVAAAKDGEPMSAEIRAWFEDYKDNLRSEGQRALLLRQLRSRFGEVPPSMIARIEAAATPLLEKWGERVISAQTLADVFSDAN